jgi:hypothetical protein
MLEEGAFLGKTRLSFFCPAEFRMAVFELNFILPDPFPTEIA